MPTAVGSLVKMRQAMTCPMSEESINEIEVEEGDLAIILDFNYPVSPWMKVLSGYGEFYVHMSRVDPV